MDSLTLFHSYRLRYRGRRRNEIASSFLPLLPPARLLRLRLLLAQICAIWLAGLLLCAGQRCERRYINAPSCKLCGQKIPGERKSEREKNRDERDREIRERICLCCRLGDTVELDFSGFLGRMRFRRFEMFAPRSFELLIFLPFSCVVALVHWLYFIQYTDKK